MANNVAKAFATINISCSLYLFCAQYLSLNIQAAVTVFWVSFITYGVVYAWWMYRMVVSLKMFGKVYGIGRPTIGWAGLIVPIASINIPYKILLQAWDKRQYVIIDRGGEFKPNGGIAFWWYAFLISLLLCPIAFLTIQGELAFKNIFHVGIAINISASALGVWLVISFSKAEAEAIEYFNTKPSLKR